MRRLLVAILLFCPCVSASTPRAADLRSAFISEIAPPLHSFGAPTAQQDDGVPRSATDAVRARIVAARRLGDSAIAELHRLILRAEAEDDGSTKSPLKAMKAKLNELLQKGRNVDLPLPNTSGEKLSKVKAAVSKWAAEAREYLAKVREDLK